MIEPPSPLHVTILSGFIESLEINTVQETVPIYVMGQHNPVTFVKVKKCNSNQSLRSFLSRLLR